MNRPMKNYNASQFVVFCFASSLTGVTKLKSDKLQAIFSNGKVTSLNNDVIRRFDSITCVIQTLSVFLSIKKNCFAQRTKINMNVNNKREFVVVVVVC